MRKKILGAVCVLIMLIGLGITSNIQENEELPAEEKGEIVAERTELTDSEHSFTPESDEKTIIERNDVIWVTSGFMDQTKVEAKISCSNRWGITLTQDEIDLLAKIVWVESRGEPVEGQQAVVEVIFNRMASEVYPDTLYEVLSQNEPVQFCSWKIRDSAEPTEKEYDSIYCVLNGNSALLRNDTMYFSTFPLTDHIETKIGDHYFCY